MTILSLGYLTLPHLSASDLVATARAAGLAHVGLRVGGRQPDEPGEWLISSRPAQDAVQRALDLGDVRVLSVAAHYLGEAVTVQHFLPVFEVAAALDATYVCVSNYDPDAARAAQALAALCERAHAYRLRIALEFVPYSATRTLAQARGLVREAGAENLGILLDLMHFIRSGSSLADVESLPASSLSYVQLCDGPLDAPDPSRLAEEARGARLLPGHGEFPLQRIYAALPAGIAFEIETPNSALQSVAREQVAAAAAACRRSLLAAGIDVGPSMHHSKECPA